jgi:hypothetical protein
VSLKGLFAKANWLAVNRQSQSDSDSNFDSRLQIVNNSELRLMVFGNARAGGHRAGGIPPSPKYNYRCHFIYTQYYIGDRFSLSIWIKSIDISYNFLAV